MPIELYVFPPSPRAFKVMAIARHLDIEYTLKVVDLRKGEQKSPEYAALNPNMRMPTLTDGDYVLWESNAIAQYLASKRSGQRRMARRPARAARCHALAVLGPCPLGSRLCRVRIRVCRQTSAARR